MKAQSIFLLFVCYVLGASQTISYHHDKIQTANKHLIIHSYILELSCALFKVTTRQIIQIKQNESYIT